MKKAICLVLVFVIAIMIPFSASASVDELLAELIIEGAVYVYGQVRGKIDEVSDMNGEEFYNWYNDRQYDSAAWRAFVDSQIIAYKNSNKPNITPPILAPATLADESNTSLGMMYDHRYTASLMNKDMVETLNDAAVEIYLQNRRSGTLDDFNLYTEDGILTNLNCIDYPITNFGSENKTYLGFNGYYDLTEIIYDSDCIQFYTGGLGPPMFYVPSGCEISHCGCLLPDNHFYIIIGKMTLLQVNTIGYGHTMLSPAFYNDSNDLHTYYFECVSGDYLNFNDVTWNSWGDLKNPYPFHKRTINGLSVFQNGEKLLDLPYQDTGSSNNTDVWNYIDLYQKFFGYILDIEEFIPPDSFIPPNTVIPYDDDDNVIVLVPDGGGDIIYMAPDDYNNYVNNGTIIEGDQNNDFSSNTINNITNDYNNYNNSHSDSSKLDEIIEWLKKIYGKLDFSAVEPCYENFSDCFYDNLPIKGQIEEVFDQVNQSINSEQSSYSPSYLDSGGDDVSEAGYSPLDHEFNHFNPIGLNPLYLKWLYKYNFSAFKVLDAYPSYRHILREVFTFLCYGIAIIGYWRSFNSVFHINGYSVDGGK